MQPRMGEERGLQDNWLYVVVHTMEKCKNPCFRRCVVPSNGALVQRNAAALCINLHNKGKCPSVIYKVIAPSNPYFPPLLFSALPGWSRSEALTSSILALIAGWSGTGPVFHQAG